MGKQVPLVIYKGGERIVLGMASVEDNGSIEAQVAKDMWPAVKDILQPNVGEFSIRNAPKPERFPYGSLKKVE